MPRDPDEHEHRHREEALWVQRVTLLIYAAAAISGAMLVIGYATTSQWVRAGLCVLLVGLSVLAEEKPKAHSMSAVAFSGLVSMAMLLVWRAASAPLALLATTFALASWDLHAFRERLTSVDRIAEAGSHTRQHLRRLGLTLGLGLTMGLVGLWVQIATHTAIVAALIVLAAIGLSSAVGFLRRSSD